MAEKQNSFGIAQSVLQKDRRKPAVLYSPEACEEEMVHTAITSNDMDKMKLVYQCALRDNENSSGDDL